MLVDLVCDDDRVVLVCQFDDQLEGRARQDRSGRVVWVVDQDQPGAVVHGRAQLLQVWLEIGRPQRNRNVHRLVQPDYGGVGVVERLQCHHFVAIVGEGEDGSGEGLGGAGSDQHLTVGIHIEAVETPLVVGNCVAEHGHPDSGRVLVDAVADRLSGGLQHLGRAILVREALPQIDSPGRHSQRRHLPEDSRLQLAVIAEQHRTPGRSRPCSGYRHCSSAGRACAGLSCSCLCLCLIVVLLLVVLVLVLACLTCAGNRWSRPRSNLLAAPCGKF